MQYKAGQTYTMKVVIELPVTAEKDCDDEAMNDFVIDQLLRCDDIMNNISECHCVSPRRFSDDTEENAPVKLHNPEDAVKAWEDLYAHYDDAGSIINLNEVPKLSPDQIQFIQDCLDCDLSIRRYSGRGMFGRECPGAVVSDPIKNQVQYKYSWDSLGLDYIVYVP